MGTWIMGVAPCSFPIIQKGRKDGGGGDGPAACWSRSFNSNSNLARGEEHPAARAHHPYFMPVPDKSLRRLPCAGCPPQSTMNG